MNEKEEYSNNNKGSQARHARSAVSDVCCLFRPPYRLRRIREPDGVSGLVGYSLRSTLEDWGLTPNVPRETKHENKCPKKLAK